MRVYDLATFKTVMTLDAGEANASSVAFSPDGKRIVAGYSSGRARVWDVSTRLQLTLLAATPAASRRHGSDADGSEVVTASDDGTIRVWYSQPRELQTEFASSSSGGTPNPVGGAGYISNSRILTRRLAARLYVFTASGEQQAVISPGTAVDSAAWNRAGTEIVTADSDGTVDLWHAIGSNYTQIPLPSPIHLNGARKRRHESRRVPHRDRDPPRLSPRHRCEAHILASCCGRSRPSRDLGGRVQPERAPDPHRRYQRPGGGVGRLPRRVRVLGTPGPPISDIEFNKSGSEFVTASESGVVTVWAARDDRPLRSIDACPSPNTASFSPDGSKIVVACGDGSAPVFAAATGRQLTVLSAASARNRQLRRVQSGR